MRTIIEGGTIVNEGRTFDGTIIIDDGTIVSLESLENLESQDHLERINAHGCYILPGIIDDHVHFREPGLTEKADIDTESRAAAAGGVTTFFDMPNTKPQTTTLEALEEKFALARQKSHVNYSFFYGATNDNADTFPQLDIHRIPGIKLFMGSSTGNMLVDRREALERIFSSTPLPLMAHCEDTEIINRNMAMAKEEYGDDPSVAHHPEIRSVEACYESTKLAVELARKYQTRLHIAHLTTAKELEYLTGGQSPCEVRLTEGLSPCEVTAEATVSHLYFSDRDYARLGTRIKCNPAIKSERDREALQQALSDGRITVIGTDHAPHLLSQKEGGCAKAASGMPMIQFSLVTMLELVDRGVLSLERLVELMCHNPARLFEVRQRGFIRPGYRADLVLVRPQSGWTVTPDCIQSKCGWSPMEGHTYLWRVERTLCNGHSVYVNGQVDTDYIGEEVAFR
ncbi:dihydroorotase [Prevotella sp. tf2-5]|uniref:dihydroorotase n=1 Tax=Prevotella sp. tf2-5 TaxID=1761889 RepID=UPI0008E8A790|nr:dihydroorotase [Prevotella sp. tf2-5]SFO82798.1 dihydroorotase [Prevotella sp. tf2-5]